MAPQRKNTGSAIERVADKFGGFAPFSRLIGVHPSLPGQWNRRGGDIPSRYHRKILAAAKKRRVRVTPAMLVNV